jgi:LacI family transcriptional regulator
VRGVNEVTDSKLFESKRRTSVPDQTAQPPTLARIAAEAGVSLPTVSKVVNGRSDVAPGTRQRVQELLDRYDYLPVRQRSRRHDRAVADLVFTHLDSPWAVEIIRGVTESGLDVVVSTMTGPGGTRWSDRVADAGRSGAILVTSHLTPHDRAVLTRARLPLVQIDPVDLPAPDLPSVGATNWAGGLAATRHLISLGHRRIGMIGGPEDFLCSRARIDGYRAALDGAGIDDEPALVRNGDFHHRGGYEQALVLLRLPDRPTAIFAGSDEQAMGVIEAARTLSLSVPGDLSVVGFDDLPAARWASPPLTTVRQPLADMGREAGRMLARLIREEPLDNHRLELATSLVVRASTAEPVA